MYRGIYTAPPNAPEGMEMIYLPDKQVIRFDGWYNNRQGVLQAMDMPLGEFLQGLGITPEDCRRAFGSAEQAGSAASYDQAPPPVQRVASESAPRTMSTPSEPPPRVR